MVLEVFAALSLASNIVQFVDFGGKLFSKARQVHRSRDGITKDYAEVEADTNKLSDLTNNLTSSASSLKSASPVSSEEEELISVAEDCKQHANDISILLAKVRAHAQTRRWESFWRAVQMIWNEKDVKDAKDELKRLQTRVTVTLLAILRNNQSEVIKVLVDLSNHALREEKHTKELLDSKKILTDKLRDIERSVHDANDKSNETSTKLDDIACALNRWFTAGNQLAGEHRILQSLRFKSMKVRHAQIPDAHHETFNWAFTSRATADHNCPQFRFAEWLRTGHGHYWIAGKAGSGKSTLVKFLYDNPRTRTELRQWAGAKDLVTAGFFFWNSGTEMQKSVDGLLQSLLFEILRKCPILIPLAAPTRWNEQCPYQSEPSPWSLWEMKDAFQRIQEQTTISAKFCLFIDGLDEYGGDHSDLENILQGFAKSADIKLCLSSRPWNVFQNAFGRDHERRLFLEELTKADIEVYVRSKLESSSEFMSLMEMDTRYLDLVEEIVQKADGVFFWVYLIVRSILQGLVNCDRISELQRRIRLLPSKLEDYFLRTLTSTDETYLERAAETYDVALRAFQPLSLMTFSYLDEEDPYYAINAGIRPLSCRDVLYRLRTMKRRLNARCNGLLEITNYHEDPDKHESLRRIIDDLWDASTGIDDMEVSDLLDAYKVEFLHRTVRDFLNTEDIQTMIRHRILSDFQPLSAVCRAKLAQIKALPLENAKYSRQLSELMGELFQYARASDDQFQRPEIRTLDELERILSVLPPLWQSAGLSASLNSCAENGTTVTFFEHIVQNGLCGYASRKLSSPLGKRSRPSIKKLLASVLCPPELATHQIYHLPMIKLLIELSKEERTREWTKVELPDLWIDFLVSIPQTWALLSIETKEDQLQIIRLLLDIGANPRVKHDETVAFARIMQELRARARTDKSRSEEWEVYQAYKRIFQACNAGSAPGKGESEKLFLSNHL